MDETITKETLEQLLLDLIPEIADLIIAFQKNPEDFERKPRPKHRTQGEYYEEAGIDPKTGQIIDEQKNRDYMDKYHYVTKPKSKTP